jgi:flagellar biosynthetic protein FliQ
MVEYDWAMGLVNELLWDAMVVAGPLLIATLVTGVLISILQVATQIQEMTLTYVPKLVVSAVVLMLLGTWMIHRVTLFAFKMIALIPDMH